MTLGRLHVHQYIDWEACGSALGYRNVGVGLLKALEEDFDLRIGEGQVNLHFCPPGGFRPAENGGFNWLITALEHPSPHPDAVARLSKADGIIVPSKWCREVIHSVMTSPVYVVPHGVDPAFCWVERRVPPTKYHRFRYLYVGTKSVRKGLDELLWVWQKLRFHQRWNVELYLKVSVEKDDKLYDRIVSCDNVIMDCRNVGLDELVNLYHGAHCFVLPTRGEGFALTLAEAMRTGLPCIASDWSGHMDYFDEEVGYPIEGFEVERDRRFLSNWLFTLDGESRGEAEERVFLRVPKADQLAGAMILVAQQYEQALEKGRRASERIAQDYTWERAAEVARRVFLLHHRQLWEDEGYGSDYTGRSEDRNAVEGLG